MSSNWQHPELQDYEAFLCNVRDVVEFKQIGYETKRMGEQAFRDSDPVSGFPVFVRHLESCTAGITHLSIE